MVSCFSPMITSSSVGNFERISDSDTPIRCSWCKIVSSNIVTISVIIRPETGSTTHSPSCPNNSVQFSVVVQGVSTGVSVSFTTHTPSCPNNRVQFSVAVQGVSTGVSVSFTTQSPSWFNPSVQFSVAVQGVSTGGSVSPSTGIFGTGVVVSLPVIVTPPSAFSVTTIPSPTLILLSSFGIASATGDIVCKIMQTDSAIARTFLLLIFILFLLFYTTKFKPYSLFVFIFPLLYAGYNYTFLHIYINEINIYFYCISKG